MNELLSFIDTLKSNGYKTKHNGKGYSCQCPAHGGEDLNLYVQLSATGKLLTTCHSYGCSFIDIIRSVNFRYKNITPLKIPVQKKPEPNPYNIQLLRDTVSDMYQTDPTPALDYIRNRGISIDRLPDDMGYLERCFYSPGIFYPALISLIRDVTGNVVSAHRTYIQDGHKLPNMVNKKLLPAILPGITNGCAIRLSKQADTGIIYLTEGVETGLAVKQLFRERNPVVWACLSANGLSSINLPENIHRVNVFADKDKNETGRRASRSMKDRLESEGKQVRIFTPSAKIPEGSKSLDFLDMLQIENRLTG